MKCRAGSETNDEWTIEIFKNGISCDKQGKFHHCELHESRDSGPKERDKAAGIYITMYTRASCFDL